MATRKSKTPLRSKTAAKKSAESSKNASTGPRAAKRSPSRAPDPAATTASARVDQRIREIGGWRGGTLARVRELIRAADPDITEALKWSGTPVWSHDGIVCTGETYARVVKLTFARGAAIPDPARLFNASLEAGTRRAIDLREGETLEVKPFKALVKAAVALNAAKPKKATRSGNANSTTTANPDGDLATMPVKLLSGGNPQIAKGYGDSPVQAYIAAMPGWKREAGRRLDDLITRSVPGVCKAVKWNSPLYGSEGGVDGESWFLGVHCFAKYIKLAFFRGTSLRPPPPVESKVEGTRYFHIREHDDLDEAQLTTWMKQASRLPGEKM